jgi:DNA primase
MNAHQEGFKPHRYLYDYVKKKVDLADFLEVEIGQRLRWYERGLTAGCLCPLHGDGNASLRLKYIEEDGKWIYHCLGCGSSGTIINFVKEYYNLRSNSEALIWICKKYNFKNEQKMIIDCLRDAKKKTQIDKKIEFANIVTSNQCRMLLRKNYEKNCEWVANTYKRLNKALHDEDLSEIESIGFEASRKMQEA